MLDEAAIAALAVVGPGWCSEDDFRELCALAREAVRMHTWNDADAVTPVALTVEVDYG